MILPHNYRMRAFLAFLLLFALPAEAGTVSRLYTFLPNTKIQSSQVNAELDNIISTLNGSVDTSNLGVGAVATANVASNAITTAKIADGAITLLKMATGTNSYIKDYRKGCNLEYNTTVTQSINVAPPCQLIVDGWYGSLTTTASATIDSGSTAAIGTVYYVYGGINGSNGVDVEYSATPPVISTLRKNGTSSKRYLGSFVTNPSTTAGSVPGAIPRFSKTGNAIRFDQLIDGDTGFSAPGFGATYRVPGFATKIYGSAIPTITTPTGTSAGYCYANVGAAYAGTVFDSNIEVKNVVSGSNYDFFVGPVKHMIPAYQGRVSSSVIACYAQYGTVTASAMNIAVYGWEEPAELY